MAKIRRSVGAASLEDRRRTGASLLGERIAELLATADLRQALDKLIVATNTAGGPDNIGLAAVRLEATPAAGR